jgi:uncharacterized protein (TIGR03067 family)
MAASFTLLAGEQPAAGAKGVANKPIAAELQRLQGTWAGVMVGQEKNANVTLTISSNSLHFHRDTNFWFETTIELAPGKDPKQLHATIKGSAASQHDSIGKVVVAIYKIQNGTLTLATRGGGPDEIPAAFNEESVARYELRKVQKKNTELLKP